jgi:hypothetical protein
MDRRKNNRTEPKETQKTQSVLKGIQGSVNFENDFKIGDRVIIDDTVSYCLDEARNYYSLGARGTIVNFLKGGAEIVVRVPGFDRIDPGRTVVIPERYYICFNIFKNPYL